MIEHIKGILFNEAIIMIFKRGSLNIPAGAFWAKIPIFEILILIADSESTENLVKIRTCSSSGLAFCVELWPKQVLYRILVPMSCISLVY